MRTLIILITFLPLCIFSQDWRYEEFVPKYKFEILDSNNLKKARKSGVLRDLSFTGAYKELYFRDTDNNHDWDDDIQKLLKSSTVVNAKDYILEKTKDRQLLIINESHHRPEHRLFTANMLEGLYAQGYRYLGMEALFSNQHHEFTKYPENPFYLGDTTIMERGYPLMNASAGTYVKEPQFGNLIRRALDLGFQLFAYEKNGKGRELGQAKNIARIFEQDEGAKVIVHCGYGHIKENLIVEKTDKRGPKMAACLKQLTGIDPLTVDQTFYHHNNFFLTSVFDETSDIEPQVILQKDMPFKSFDPHAQNQIDMTVFHKTVSFKNERPSWLYTNPNNNVFKLKAEQINMDYPLRVKLLGINDRLDAVALDVLEADSAPSVFYLYGALNEAKVVVENKEGNRQVLFLMKN